MRQVNRAGLTVEGNRESGGAIFDPTGQYRYHLWREWNPQAPRLGFVMLNPSRADASFNDPTIRRCLGLAQTWDYGAVEVGNLFAYRATHPQELCQVCDPVGLENDRYLLEMQPRVQCLILAWGNHGRWQNRARRVLGLLSGNPLYCLGLTRLGQPRHPLYVKQGIKPVEFQEPAGRAGTDPGAGVG